MEEWISLNEYCKRFKMGKDTVKKMISNKELETRLTPSGYFKIKVGGNSVSKDLYEKAIERAIRAETKLKNILAIAQ